MDKVQFMMKNTDETNRSFGNKWDLCCNFSKKEVLLVTGVM